MTALLKKCESAVPRLPDTRDACRMLSGRPARQPTQQIQGVAPTKPTGRHLVGALEFEYDSHRHSDPDLQPRLSARPDRTQPAGYRFLQAVDGANDPRVLSEPAGHVFGHQPLKACPARRG